MVSGEDFDVCLCSVRPVRPNAGVATVCIGLPGSLQLAQPFNRCFSGSSRHRAALPRLQNVLVFSYIVSYKIHLCNKAAICSQEIFFFLIKLTLF